MADPEAYLPLSEYLPAEFWPADLFSGAAGEDGTFLDLIAWDSGEIMAGEERISARVALRVMAEVAFDLPAGFALVLGVGPVAASLEVDEEGFFVQVFAEVFKLRLPRSLFAPVVERDGRLEPDPDPEHFVEVALPLMITVDHENNIDLEWPGESEGTLGLPRCMIGESGVVISAEGMVLRLSANAPLPEGAGDAGLDSDWRGIFLREATIHLPEGLGSAAPDDIRFLNASIGTGGFSGIVTADWAPAFSGALFGVDLSLQHFGLSFVQNAITGSEIRGTLKLPFFDEPVEVDISFNVDGSLAVRLSSASGLATLEKEGILRLELESLGFVVQEGVFTVRLSGTLKPLVGNLDWPGFAVKELSIDSDGNVHLDGGWLNLPDQYALTFYGFQFEITKLGLGSTDDGGKWVGFSGELKLVDGMRAGASVEGLRLTWFDDGRPPALTLNGVGVEFEVPGVLRFKGAVSYRELPDGVRRFDGSIRLMLTTLNLEIDGQLVIGTVPGYTFFAIYLGVELPAGIPLWTTGLGLYGLSGLFAFNMEPDKAPTEPWYGIGPNEGWYKKPQIGVTDLVKWRNQAGSLAIGAGVTIGTVADNGFTFAGRMLLAIVFPGPLVFIEGKANLLKERSSLREDPIFRALAVIDGRERNVLIGLDAAYKFASGGEVIEIGGGAEAFFDFDDPMSWHLYLGMRDPKERRIRAEIFKLFEANAYLMLDPRQLAMGAFVGYDNSWRFGPVSAALEAWIEGHALISFKPVHFHGELWLHGRLELRVFGFGFDIGADARVSADVFKPFSVRIELSAHLGLPWPLPDFDVDITLEWGPEPTPPPLPMPLKEIAVEHFKVTTSWPLPRTSDPALLAPNYDGDADGFLAAPVPDVAVVAAAAPPRTAPAVPLDGRPHVTFGRAVNDDALVGINPQPAFPEAQPDPEWEWIGDPAKNEGPVRMRVGLKEVALERWNSAEGNWVTVARKSQNPNPADVPALYGSWAPVPQLPGGAATAGSPAPVGNTKLWLWSRSAFDYARYTSGGWTSWCTSAYPNYPCVPMPPNEEICCDFSGLQPGMPMVSPWRCPKHPEFAIGWPFPIRPTVVVGRQGPMLCFGSDDRIELRFGRTVKRARLFVQAGRTGEGERGCLDFRDRERRESPNPFEEAGYQFLIFDHTGTPRPNVRFITRALPGGGTIGALDLGFRARVTLPTAADAVDLLITCAAGPIQVSCLAADGSLVDRQQTAATGQPERLMLAGGMPIATVDVVSPQNEAMLHEICLERGRHGVRVVGVSRAGAESPPVTVVGGVAELPGRELAAIRVSAEGQSFCLLGFCVDVGLSRGEQNRRDEMAQHLVEETARWSQEGFVLKPNTDYRVRVVTTLETRDFAYDATFNQVREQTEFAFFRTAGPPGIVALSRPLTDQAPAEFESGLDDLTRYVDQTVPPTVPAAGEKPLLPRPVYRAYDAGVRFNEDYVDLLYRSSGRDLGVYLYDNNNQPARDAFGRLLTAPNRWGHAERLMLTETDRQWVDTVNASTCTTIDESLIVRNRTLGIEGQVLAADTLYEARLVPLLLHETFDAYAVSQSASGGGATLSPSTGGNGWVVVDMGGNAGPSRWVIGAGATPVTRYVEQQSNIWGGPDITADPTNPGTILLLASDAGLPGNHPDQPGNWTDYRVTAILRALDDDAIGLVVRYHGPDNHYLVAFDSQRAYRRLVRVAGGVYTILAADGVAYKPSSNMTITIEAMGSRLRVYQDGALVFDVPDATHAQGGIGLYCWAAEGARFADVRVDDFRITAPVVYRFPFTTSRFTDFFHQIHSATGETWQAPLPDLAGVPDAVAVAVPLASLPAAVGDAESRAYMALAEKATGQAARKDPLRLEASALTTGADTVGLLLRTAEPVDWSRTTLTINCASGPGPAFDPMVDAVPSTGPMAIVGWSSAPGGAATPIAESVTVMLHEQLDPNGWQLQYRTLPSAIPAPAPDGKTLLEDPFLDIATLAVEDGGALFQPAFNDLAGFAIHDPPVLPLPGPWSRWAAAAGVVTQTGVVGTISSGPTGTFALHGSHLTGGDPGWRDVALTVRLRTDIATGAIGVLLRYVDERNHYRFSMAPSGSYRRLVKCEAGVFSLLWEDTEPVAIGQDYDLRFEAVGGDLRVLLDGVELCAIRDTGIAAGQVGLYAWRCKAASFTQLVVFERSRHVPGWDLIDVGPLTIASFWQQGGGALLQTAAIGSLAIGAADSAAQGAYAITGDPAWTDIRVRVRIALGTPDAVGVAVRWQGPGDHLLFVLDARVSTARLIRQASGVAATLWSGSATVPLDTWRNLLVETIGTRVRATLNGTLLCDLHDATHAEGRAGLYVCATGSSRFSEFAVEAARPMWFPYATVAGIGPLAGGRRVRLFAGREEDLTLPPVTGEVRQFLGFFPGDSAGARLPPEGFDLRLIAADGQAIHARRVPPAEAFAAEPVSLLRAADGTGLILVAPAPAAAGGSRLSPGIYRLDWRFRRDNTTQEPGSLILSENGDTADEEVRIQVPI